MRHDRVAALGKGMAIACALRLVLTHSEGSERASKSETVHYIVAGRGEMWRRQGTREETVALEPGVCLSIPLGTRFQFRASPDQPVSAVAVTLPAWPGDGEALPIEGFWAPNGG